MTSLMHAPAALREPATAPLKFNLCRSLAPRTIGQLPGAPSDFGRDLTDSIALAAFAANRDTWHGDPVPGGTCLPLDSLFTHNVLPTPQGPVPWEPPSRALDTSGASMAFVSAAPFATALRAKLGPVGNATRIVSTYGVASMPVQQTPATATATVEVPGVDAPQSTPTFEAKVWTLAMLDAIVVITRQQFFSAATNFDMDGLIQRELAAAIGDKMLLMIATGAGSGGESLGFIGNSAVPVHPLGANGGTFGLSSAATCEKAIGDLNAEGDALAWWSTTAARSKLRQTERWTGSGTPLWTDADTVIGRPAFATTVLPSNLTKGSGSSLSALVYGDWRAYGVALWSVGAEFLADPFAQKERNLIEILCRVFAATRPIRDSSFIRVLDMVTT